MEHLYPHQLAEFVYDSWPEKKNRPQLAVLEDLFSTCYQASMLSHEGATISFRLLLDEPENFPDEAGPPHGLHKLVFTEHAPITVNKLRRLSPAASFSRSLIGVRLDPQKGPLVWGIIHSGPRWLHAILGGRGHPPELPQSLLIKVTGPGVIEVARGDHTLAILSEGKIIGESINVFQSKWLQDWMAPIRQERQELHLQAREQADDDWADLEPDLTRTIEQHLMRRILAAMRAYRLGGTLLIVPQELTETLTSHNPYLSIKYGFIEAEPRARFRSLIINIMNKLAQIHKESKRPVTWQDYQRSTDPEILALDESIFEMSHLVSTLSTADGAVVLTKRFELLGFGAEIICESLDTQSIARALDLEGTMTRRDSVNFFGSRHRSVYRFCDRLQDTMAIVLSKDGSLQFVKWNDGQLKYWEHQGSFDFSAIG